MDGLKTGFTDKAGYCLTATATRNNMRFLTVVMGVETSDKRSNDTVNMMSNGFNTYKLNTIMTTKEELGKIKIEQGKIEHGTLVLKKDMTELLKITDPTIEYTFSLKTEKVNAPLKNGDVVGIVEVIDNEGNIIREEELTIKENIKKANLWDLFSRNLKIIISGKKSLTKQ